MSSKQSSCEEDDASDDLAEFSELLANPRSPEPRPAVDAAVRSRRRRRWRRASLITASILAIALATTGGYVAWALNAPLAAPQVTSQLPPVSIPSDAVLAFPLSGASAVSVSGADEYLGAGAGGVWVTSGTNDPLPIASITKLITALVILDAVPLADAHDQGPTLTFSKADHALYDQYYVQGATIVAMPTGSTMSLHDALATMLIPSASNYADAVANWAFGSRGGFVSATRNWLSAHGLTGTTIIEPTGISERNVSTPTDLLTIGKLAAANPAIAAIAGTASLTLPVVGSMSNTNELLGREGITGLKTGNLGNGTYNLLFTSTLNIGTPEPLSVVGVILGGGTRQSASNSAIALLESIRGGFQSVPLARPGQVVGSFSTPWGASAQMIIASSPSIFTWSATPITVTMDTFAPKTYRAGEVIGSVTWVAGPRTVTVDVVFDGAIEPPTAWWRLTHPEELGG